MSSYTFTTNLIRDNGLCYTVTVSFRHLLPEQSTHWHHPCLGSIFLLEVVNQTNHSMLSVLFINEHVALKKECWRFMETQKAAL